MALRHLAGKLRTVPAGAALRRAEASRGVASGSSHICPTCSCLRYGKEVNVEAPRAASLWSKEDLQRMTDDNEDIIRRINEVSLHRERYERLDALYVSAGTVFGLFVGVLMLRYEIRNGGKVRKRVLGLPTE